MVGKVSSVAPFPARPESLLRVLENQTLVNEFSRQGAPIEVVVQLETSSNSVSGYRWTSGKGPAVLITSGTLCEGTITMTNHRPISLVLPVFKESIAW
jgi:HlyD family secretion protein